HRTEVHVEPGQTTQVTLGDTGGVLQGQIRFETQPPPDTDLSISGNLTTPMPKPPEGLSPDQMKAFFESPEWKERVRQFKSYAVAIGTDGRVLMDSIPPGDYKLRITATENDKMAQFPFEGKALAVGETDVTVPADASPATAISLGEILLKPQPTSSPRR